MPLDAAVDCWVYIFCARYDNKLQRLQLRYCISYGTEAMPGHAVTALRTFTF